MKKLVIILFVFILLITSCKKNQNNETENNTNNNDNQTIIDKKIVTINYHINDEVITKKYEIEKNRQLEVFDCYGYEFHGWLRSDGITVTDVPTKEGVYDFYANLSKLKFKLIKNIDGTSETSEYDYLTEIQLTNLPSTNNKIFKGWGLSLDATEYIDSIILDANKTVYAIFEEFNPIKEAMDNIILPTETDVDLSLPTKYQEVNISWKSSAENSISSTGKVVKGEYSPTVSLTASFEYNSQIETKVYKIKVGKLSPKEVLDKTLAEYEFSYEIKDGQVNFKKNFATPYNYIVATWTSDTTSLVSDEGYIVNYPDVKTTIKMHLVLTLKEEKVENDYFIEVNPISLSDRVRLIEDELNYPTIIMNNQISLPTTFENGLVGSWQSSDESIITNSGKVNLSNQIKDVKLTLTLSYLEESIQREYNMRVYKNDMLKVISANDFDQEKMTNLELKDNRIVLKAGELSGSYLSGDIEINNSKTIVPTWVSTSSNNETVLFSYQIFDGSKWSGFIRYSKTGWGFGLHNIMESQNDGVAKTNEDITELVNGGVITKLRFKLEFKRTSLDYEGPKLAMVTFMLEPNNIVDNFSLENIPNKVLYDVPKLYQRAVPNIGGIICSATSSTMLLKYKGENFLNKDNLEHRYIAEFVKDYGNNIYGNWVYNCVGMAAFGYTAYVERLAGIKELVHHLIHIGPAALTVRGTMASNVTTYTTAGHLLVIKGYTYNDGVLTFIANDPNVNTVECTYSSDLISSTWRGVVYTIE